MYNANMALPNDADAFLLSGVEALTIRDLVDDGQECNICYEVFAEDDKSITCDQKSATSDSEGVATDNDSATSQDESAISNSKTTVTRSETTTTDIESRAANDDRITSESESATTDSDNVDAHKDEVDNEGIDGENGINNNESGTTDSGNISTTDDGSDPPSEDEDDAHEPEQAVRIIKCGHVFGEKCLEKHVRGLFDHSRSCPLCRAPLFRGDDKEIRNLILDHELTRAMLSMRHTVLGNMRQVHNMAPHFLGRSPANDSILHTLKVRNMLETTINNYRSCQQELRDIRQKIHQYVEENQLTEGFARVVELVVQDGEDLKSAWQAEFGPFRL